MVEGKTTRMTVGIRRGAGTTRINVEETVNVSPPTDGAGIRYAQSLAWRKAALKLYRKHFGGTNHHCRVIDLSYSGAMRPFGTWHVQFGTAKNPTSLSEMFIVNVDEA